MRPLSTYIEYLLMSRHYAFVPGLGGFMFQEEPARMMLGGRLMPPLRILKYNRFLNHDDGMLANVIMRSEGLSYDEANQAIRLSVQNLLNTVQHEGRCALGHLGFVFFDDECHIAFRANDQVSQDPTYYGMSQINAKSWREVEAERTGRPLPSDKTGKKTEKPRIKHHDGIVEFPTRWLRYAAIALIVICFLVGNMIPWSNSQTNSAHLANMVDTGCLFRYFNEPVPQTWSNVFEAEKEMLAQPAPTTVASTPAPTTATASTEKRQTRETVKSTKTSSRKQYIVIVGSCKSEKECNRLLRRLAKKGYDDLHVYESDGRFRIYIDQFTVKKEAFSYLENLRQTTPFTDAWLLGVRSEDLSLSYIIKNKDNDQLPMELSHFNSTAERDQG